MLGQNQVKCFPFWPQIQNLSFKTFYYKLLVMKIDQLHDKRCLQIKCFSGKIKTLVEFEQHSNSTYNLH